MNKTIRVYVRLTPEMVQKLDEFVDTVPRGRGEVIRAALDLFFRMKDLERQAKEIGMMHLMK